MRSAGVALIAVALSGCASVAEGTAEPSQQILFTSNPTGAEVMQSGQVVCRTPCQVVRSELKLMEGYTFLFGDGSEQEVALETEANAAVLGNILVGGVVGGVVDLATGRGFVREGHVHVEQEAQTRP